jgi:hypothetical protein
LRKGHFVIHTVSIEPTTCDSAPVGLGCKLSVTWDDQVVVDQRTFTPETVDRRCARHTLSAYPTLDSLFAQLTAEQECRSRVLGHIETQFPTWYDPDTGELLEGALSFDAGGALHFICPDVSQDTRNAFQDWCDTNLGFGRVVIE